jgi:hypothetical protein
MVLLMPGRRNVLRRQKGPEVLVERLLRVQQQVDNRRREIRRPGVDGGAVPQSSWAATAPANPPSTNVATSAVATAIRTGRDTVSCTGTESRYIIFRMFLDRSSAGNSRSDRSADDTVTAADRDSVTTGYKLFEEYAPYT